MSGEKRLVIFVHGWSVRNTDTYGELPARLRSEAARDPSLGIDVREIWLSQYISFHNEVRLEDISRAFDAAIRREFGDALRAGRRFACITHSTGGPVVRDWLQRNYLRTGRRRTPLSHLIMLAPANFGSALAQLGHSRLARLRTWFEGVEPGLGVLDWLELGSPESLALNLEWLERSAGIVGPQGVFPFVLTGASIDRKLYDHVNSYTGEMGTDGVVRVAAANLAFTHVTLAQEAPRHDPAAKAGLRARTLVADKPRAVDGVPLALIEGRSHSGDAMGIQRSVRDDGRPHPTVTAVLDCLRVRTLRDYAKLRQTFAARNADVMARQRVEIEDLPGPFDRTRIHDPCSMLVFRVRDDQGNPLKDYEIILTAGRDGNPDALPPGFFIDRQRNRRDPGVVTYYINHARMTGCGEVRHGERLVRPALPACEALGLRIVPYPQDGFVHYLPAELTASPENLERFVRPHQTTVIDIVLRRVVREGVFRLTRETSKHDFTKAPPGDAIPSA
ncbi:MAG TPA: phospholipase [Gammaproteobacteria bacterium]|nr:phospholipase [Gammaproteobacteria bacterium]